VAAGLESKAAEFRMSPGDLYIPRDPP
jgi:hypothetical protein